MDRYTVRAMCAGRMETIENNISYDLALSIASNLILKYHVVEVVPSRVPKLNDADYAYYRECFPETEECFVENYDYLDE